MDLLYPFRVLTGRRLSPVGIMRANSGWGREYMYTAQSLSREGSEIIFSYTCDDFGGMYHETIRYTNDGRIISKEKRSGGRRTKTVYDPPGRFWGKTADAVSGKVA